MDETDIILIVFFTFLFVFWIVRAIINFEFTVMTGLSILIALEMASVASGR